MIFLFFSKILSLNCSCLFFSFFFQFVFPGLFDFKCFLTFCMIFFLKLFFVFQNDFMFVFFCDFFTMFFFQDLVVFFLECLCFFEFLIFRFHHLVCLLMVPLLSIFHFFYSYFSKNLFVNNFDIFSSCFLNIW